MEHYYAQSDGKTDARPELSYQVGVTPEGTERARPHCSLISQLPDGHRPNTLCPPEADPKWRFFWRVGPRPEVTNYKQLNAPPVIPAGFKEWSSVMDTWGGKMIGALEVVGRMVGMGLGLGPDSIPSLMDKGPHLLAPTGSDFGKHGTLGTVLAGFHYDLNLLTIHGKSRFPGLSVWLRDGRYTLSCANSLITTSNIDCNDHACMLRSHKTWKFICSCEIRFKPAKKINGVKLFFHGFKKKKRMRVHIFYFSLTNNGM
ncbi:unnamed protein product [Choristocarpus tenellus]